MSRCDFDRILLMELAIGELDAPDRLRVEEHVQGCASCTAEVDYHRTLSADLSDRPDPSFPSDLEEVLVRSAVQARHDMVRVRRPNTMPSRVPFSWTPVLCASAGLAIVAVLVLILMPGTFTTGSSVDKVVSGGMGRGATAFGDAMQFWGNLKQGWSFVADFLAQFAPVWRAVQTAIRAVGAERWGALVVGAVIAAVLLWRVTRSGQKRSIEHAKAGN